MLKNQKLDENLLNHTTKMTTEQDFPLRTDKAVISIAVMMFSESWERAKTSPQAMNVFRNEITRLTTKLLKQKLVDPSSRGF